MRKLALTLTLSAAALAIGGSSVALADHHGGKRGPMAADTDNDGVITLAEAKAHSAERFAKMDVNSDGVINREDREAKHAEHFAAADTDGNGELSADEMVAAHEARREKRMDRRAERMADRFEMLDTDKSGGISQAEMMAGREARKGARGERMRKRRGMRSGPRHMEMRMLHQADANGDKSVTRAEFDAAVESHFAKVDADSSGSITAKERKAAMAAMKEQMHERRGERRNAPGK